MVVFKVRKFRKGHKPLEPEKDLDNKPIKSRAPRRKKMRRRRRARPASSSEWRDVEAEGRRWWGGFDVVYEKYCELMFFDRMSEQQLNVAGSQTPSTPSPKSASKKLASPFRCLSLKKIEQPGEETENLQQPENDPYQDLETAYVAQICLTWEALHCQYTQMSQKISCQPENPTCYNQSAQELQQFQNLNPVYLLRLEDCSAQKENTEEEQSDSVVLSIDLMRIIESSILTLHLFIKIDKKRSGGVLNLFGNQSQIATPLHQVQSLLVKKGTKLKELRKRRKGWKKKSWPQTWEDIELLFGLIDIKVMSRVLRMVRITKEQLFWCEEKMKKLDLTDGKLQRDPSPILFPC
ncbi:hypothetical protein EZV62_004493 [Acer yangbiense]|uniref:Uncharacterized protein n=1 Tax=Acer yangbiense TaxID=1000413 RepID=A0A5C7IK41_9ROSI|nr:hypothetical protein EZV62_004493 [Acer yangbiense]